MPCRRSRLRHKHGSRRGGLISRGVHDEKHILDIVIGSFVPFRAFQGWGGTLGPRSFDRLSARSAPDRVRMLVPNGARAAASGRPGGHPGLQVSR